ncbi:hypothetical protein J1614_010759 [Plenodomus biglobosus]|nr:hypothetical protein J1614_010759 [Plenodomus biglobosus]
MLLQRAILPPRLRIPSPPTFTLQRRAFAYQPRPLHTRIQIQKQTRNMSDIKKVFTENATPPPLTLQPSRSLCYPQGVPSKLHAIHIRPPQPTVLGWHDTLTHHQSQAIIAGSQIYVSGQIPADSKGNLIEGSITDKTAQCCENIKVILAEAGVGMERIVKVNVFLDDMAYYAEMNDVFSKYFAHRPARSCVAVKQLPKGVPVEIECIAFAGMPSKL